MGFTDPGNALGAGLADRVDRTAVPFVTLDPAASTDLDQAFPIEPRGGDLPAAFGEITDRILAAERRRGAARVDPPEREVMRTADGYDLRLQPRREVEDRDAALSLVTNLVVADALLDQRTGCSG